MVRSQELNDAGVPHSACPGVELHDYTDGNLAAVPLDELADHILRLIGEERPSHLLVFDLGGVTGHPDDQHATEAVLSAAHTVGPPVLAWTVPRSVPEQLNAELGTTFTGRDP